MEIGIAFPKVMPAGDSGRIVEWAERADDGPFSSLAMVDRLVYGNHDPLIVFAVAAAVTSRIRLMPTVLLLSLRNAAIVIHAFGHLEAALAGHQRRDLGRQVEAIEETAVLPADGERVREALGGDQGNLGKIVLDDGVGDHGGAVDQVGDLAPVEANSLERRA